VIEERQAKILTKTLHLRPGCLCSWVRGHHGDATNSGRAGRVGLGDTDVSTFTPAGAPRVLDDPEVLAVFGTVTNDEDTVVERGTAGGAVDDTTLVELEDRGISLDGSGDWASSDSGGELNVIVGGNGNPTEVLENDLGLVEFAGSLGSGVWVDGTEFNSVVTGVLEGSGHNTAIASVSSVGAGTIDELLLRESLQESVLNSVEAFQSTDGGERPAGTAVALVLHWGDCVLASPVNSGGDSGGGSLENCGIGGGGSSDVGWAGSEVSGSEFFSGHISELVEFNLVWAVFGLHLLDLVVVLFEDSESVIFFLSVAVESVSAFLPLLESFLDFLGNWFLGKSDKGIHAQQDEDENNG